MVSSKQAKGGKEIPTPLVRAVPSYSIEYLPVHKEPRVYIRGKGKHPDPCLIKHACVQLEATFQSHSHSCNIHMCFLQLVLDGKKMMRWTMTWLKRIGSG